MTNRSRARGYETITNPRKLPEQFNTEQRKLSGLLIPITNTQGEPVAWKLKPDEPRTVNGKQPKYEFAGRVSLDAPAAARPYLHDVEAALWITEGAKKVDSAVSNGIPCCIGVQGVDMWRQDGMALPDWRDIALKGRDCIIAFDSDVMTKQSVRRRWMNSHSTWSIAGQPFGTASCPICQTGRNAGSMMRLYPGLTRADLEALVVESCPAPNRTGRNRSRSMSQPGRISRSMRCLANSGHLPRR